MFIRSAYWQQRHRWRRGRAFAAVAAETTGAHMVARAHGALRGFLALDRGSPALGGEAALDQGYRCTTSTSHALVSRAGCFCGCKEGHRSFDRNPPGNPLERLAEDAVLCSTKQRIGTLLRRDHFSGPGEDIQTVSPGLRAWTRDPAGSRG